VKQLLEPGKYIVAVSGGVDSVALLHMLKADKNLELVVAHFDHGIRPNSSEDLEFVRELAAKSDLSFISKREELGPGASEALARERRYNFLRLALKQFKAKAIVTAHHQDDLIETALLNVLRGTKHKGLVSLRSTDEIERPLLGLAKRQISDYATEHGLEWREDPTNKETDYKRNQIRAVLTDTLTDAKRQEIIRLLKEIELQSPQIEQLVNEYLTTISDEGLSRAELKKLAQPEAYEVLAGWLRSQQISFDTKTLERIYKGAKNLNTGAQIDLQKGHYCELSKDRLVIKQR
jgi:tRNA(Ile)-lysidine synthetase-like protein